MLTHWKDPDAGRDWGQEEKGTTEDEMAGWHHWLDGRESEWTLGVGDGQGGLACCDAWGRKESDTTERLIWSDLIWSTQRLCCDTQKMHVLNKLYLPWVMLLLAMNSMVMNEQYILNKVSSKRSIYKTRICVDQMMKILWPEAYRNRILYFP